MPDNIYQKQAELLLRILPSVMREDVFALKGGTAINFFWRDYPRLSVDIDLTYLPIKERDISLLDINDRFASIEARIKRIFPSASMNQKLEGDTRAIVGLIVRDKEVTVKVEANFNLRGAVYSPVKKKLSDRAEKEFGLSVIVNTLSFEDLYGGKIVAALDRQHPRDFFDIKLLLENEGLTDGVRKAFIVYLISHNRSLMEVLNPGLQDIKSIFESDFVRMTAESVKLDDLLDARAKLIKKIKESLTENEKKFLLSWKSRNPEWKLLGIEGIENMPGVRRRLMNLEQISPEKHKQAFEKLKRYFE
ncbi:MAG TPA: nucleotidyl transferase AbiEii/AbiGii toxin family protein [Ignavibacteriaceae bacterium]|nr:nucleotidyl transferase AbiEii/AbiGii toxin family protein [Ignavibacteriaceae bacterium]